MSLREEGTKVVEETINEPIGDEICSGEKNGEKTRSVDERGHEKDGERERESVFFKQIFRGKEKGLRVSNTTTQHGVKQTHTRTHRPTHARTHAPTKALFNLCLLPLSHSKGSVCFCQLSLTGVEAGPFAPPDPNEDKTRTEKYGPNQNKRRLERTNQKGPGWGFGCRVR